MRGHEPLIAMRLRGFTPRCVWIDLDPDKSNAWRDWPAMDNTMARLYIDASESRPDLRPTTGLTCYIVGSDIDRVRSVRDTCIECGAKRVIATVMQPGRGDTWTVRRMSDTEGVWLG